MIYTITSVLSAVHGGRTKALLKRNKLLEAEFGESVTIVTTNYNANYKRNYNQFIDKNLVTDKTKFENIYEWLSDYKLLDPPRTKFFKRVKVIETNFNINGLDYRVNKEKNTYEYFDKKNKMVLIRKYYSAKQILRHEIKLDKKTGKHLKKKEYNQYGFIHKITNYAKEDEEGIKEEYLDINGNKYCEMHFEDIYRKKLKVILLYKKGEVYNSFTKEKSLFQYYFNQIFNNDDIVFNDARLLDRPLLQNKNKTKNVLVFHSSHIKDEKIKKSYGLALENHLKVSKYIVATQNQKEDILSSYEMPNEKICVMPHSVQNQQYQNEIEVKNQFCYMGRFDKDKQLTELLEAFKLHVDRGYNTQLVMYGANKGNALKEVKETVQKLSLDERVTIYNFTSNPKKVFSESKASLLTSKFEGFGLTVLESISMGCPVISYNIKYGPNEIINNGVNGYLVNQNDIEAFSDMLDLIIDKPLSNVENQKKYLYENVVKNHKSLLNEIK